MKTKITIVALLLIIFCQGLFAQIPLVYDVENTGAQCSAPPLPLFNQLPVTEPLTDPFMWSDGRGRLSSFSDWACRRNEIRREIENYEIGIKPPRPDTMTATYTPGTNGGTLTVVVTRNGRALTLTSRINIPSGGSGPFPAVIGMALAPGSGTGSLPADIFTSRNVATIEYLHNQVTTYAAGQKAPKTNDPFYLLYPELINNGQYSAWIWGISRLIDGLEIAQQSLVNRPPIDLKHLAVTGCSYAGKMALFAGAFDERIALTIAQESGGGGAPSWRVSHSEPNGTVEKIDNTDYSWFMESMRQFAGDNVYKLPLDHHELMAMIAPRALLVTGNTDFTWLSNRSCYVSARAAHEVWKSFGVGDRFGFYIDGGHGHCAIPQSQRPAIGAFVDKFLLGKTDVNTDTITVHPYGELDYQRWYQWWGKGEPAFPAEPASVKVWMESECATVGANWDILSDTVASNGKYVTVKSGFNNTSSAPTEAADAVVFTFTVDSAATYNFLARVNCPSADDDSYWVKIDDGAFVMANGLTTSGWQWVRLANAALSPGQHTLTISYREDGAKLDKVLVTTSGATITGLGEVGCNQKPVVLPSQSFTINDKVENNTLIGTVKAFDPDTNATLQDWQITGGTGAAMFSINASTGEMAVSNRTLLDFENTRSYTLEVSVGDGAARSEVETVTIYLTNVPVITPLQVFHIEEWVTDNYVVGYVLATDRDSNTTFRDWKITGGTGASLFAINDATGQVKASNSSTLNFSKTSSYTLYLTVSDGMYTSLEDSITITISEKVNICHSGSTMSVRRSKVPDHIKHGDPTSACESSASMQASHTSNTETAYGEKENDEVLIYPNPGKEEMFVHLRNNTQHINAIQVIDLSGKSIMRIPVNNPGVISIPVGLLNPGLYLVRMYGDTIITRRIIVQ